MRRFVHHKGLCLLLFSLWIALPALAEGYLVVLKSGQVYSCDGKPTRSKGLVCFTEVRGSEICVERYEIDWYETARSNGETPPPGSKTPSDSSISQGTSKWISWLRSLIKKPGMSQLQTARSSGLTQNEWKRMGLLFLFQALANVIGAFLFRLVLGMLAEPVPYFKLLLYHVIVFVIHGACVWGLTQFDLNVELVFVLRWFLYAFIWTTFLSSTFEVDIPHAFLGTLFYCFITFVLNGTAGFIVNTLS